MQQPVEELPFTQVSSTVDKRSTSNADFAPLRIHVVFHESLLDNPIINEVFTSENGPFRQALNVISNGLTVVPARGNITIPPDCSVIQSGPRAGTCESGTLSDAMCGIFPVPEELVGVRETCNLISDTCSDEGPSGAGVEADYILFTGALNGM